MGWGFGWGGVCGACVGLYVSGLVCKSQTRKMIERVSSVRLLGDTGSMSSRTCLVCGAVLVLCWAVCWRCVSVGGVMGSGRCRGCTGGDQTACVPTLASMGTRRFESWSIIWGKKNCIISPRWGAVCRARCVQGEVQAVAPCDLSRSLAPHHSPPTAWFKGRCGVKGGHSVGCDPGARCTWGARWVEGG